MRLCIAALLGLVVISGCAAHGSLRPVGKKGMAMRAGMGGPIVAAFGTNLPVPYATTGIDYGLSDNLNFTADAHLLPLFYQIIGGEAGVAWFPLAGGNRSSDIGLGVKALVFGSVKGAVRDRLRIYPVLSATAARHDNRGVIYGGLSATLVPRRADAYDSEASPMIVSPALGARRELGAGWSLGVELKWQGANIRSDRLAVEYIHPFGRGALAPLIVLEKRL